MLRVDLDLDRPLLEVFLEFQGAPLEIIVPVLVELTHVEAVLDPCLLQLCILSRKHHAEGLGLIMHDVLWQRGGDLFGKVPF